jgi:uncharacterized protein GlcG (DUF336 family)
MSMALSFDDCVGMVQRAFAKAADLGLHIAVVILDAGGHVLMASRDHAAGWAVVEIAQAKARAALAFRAAPAAMQAVAEATLLRLPAAQREGMLFAGGARLVEQGGQVLGAIAVSGGTEELDEMCVDSALQRS